MQFFTKTRRGQIVLAAGLFAGFCSLLAIFGLWALALAGTTTGLVIINLLIAENVHKARRSAMNFATRERHSSKGINSSVARIEASLSALARSESKNFSQIPKSTMVADSVSDVVSTSAIATLESIGRTHEFQQWWSLHSHLIGECPKTATALSLPPVLSRLSEGQTVLFVGTVATASWAYETLISLEVALGRAYLGFRTAIERDAFESFVAGKMRRVDHVTFILEPAPPPAMSMGNLPATAVDMMLVDFGASESHQEVLAAIPGHYWRWLREDSEVVVLDSRQGLATQATNSVLGRYQYFVVVTDSGDPYIRNLKRAAL